VSALLVALGALAGFGIVLVLAGLVPDNRSAGPARGGSLSERSRHPAADPRQLLAAAVCGIAVLALTRWPVAALLGAGAVLGFRTFAGAPSGAVIGRLDAIATWTEMLRDTLGAAAGLSQALVGTAKVAPAPIRDEVQLLATRVTSGVPPRDALVALADDLADQSADIVVAALLMAVEHRAQRLGDLLGELATTTRDQVAMRLRVEASRASARTALRTITGFTVAFVSLLVVFSRSYLAPFGTATGQLVLALVGALFALGLALMARMARPAASPRLVFRGDRP
jgi:tight adherence protein B